MISIKEIKHFYPNFYSALEELAYSNDMKVNDDYSFPEHESERIKSADDYLGKLSIGQLEDFIDGSYEDRIALLVTGGQKAVDANVILEKIFDGEYVEALC